MTDLQKHTRVTITRSLFRLGRVHQRLLDKRGLDDLLADDLTRASVLSAIDSAIENIEQQEVGVRGAE